MNRRAFFGAIAAAIGCLRVVKPAKPDWFIKLKGLPAQAMPRVFDYPFTAELPWPDHWLCGVCGKTSSAVGGKLFASHDSASPGCPAKRLLCKEAAFTEADVREYCGLAESLNRNASISGEVLADFELHKEIRLPASLFT
jgi:hypothetical protein